MLCLLFVSSRRRVADRDAEDRDADEDEPAQVSSGVRAGDVTCFFIVIGKP